ncbi:Amylopullulanase precursor [Anoxybacillus sp. BCO1]|nr:Amylopullulanase precursor [Anoxybacillus sp. BCO1]
MDPEKSTAFLIDDNFDSIYTFTARVPKGMYEFKVTLGNSWAENYPQDDAKLNVLEDTTITFFLTIKEKTLYTDYSPTGSDGAVQKDRLKHNTWDSLYRQPFGAVKAGESVTLRLAAKKGDLTKANVYVKNTTTGTAKLYTMNKVGVIGDDEYWEATFKPDDKGLYAYKFIAMDGSAKAEYGEDTQEGQWGRAVDKNAELFQLTVYDPNYKTPDWMKHAVVYQIFPDRFFNGNPNNDNAKSNARGNEPIERRQWSQLPDNPRMKGTTGYDGDGIWSNDFFGGDIAGIEQKLDYLQSIGVNTIYLNPIAPAPSNHKYDAHNFKELDPMFGTPEEFQSFVQAVASRGMHLILDGVFNHVSDDSIYFDRYGKYKTVGAYEYWSAVYDLMNEKGLSEEEARAQVEQKFKNEGQEFSPYGFHLWFNIENEKVNGVYKYQSWWDLIVYQNSNQLLVIKYGMRAS